MVTPTVLGANSVKSISSERAVPISRMDQLIEESNSTLNVDHQTACERMSFSSPINVVPVSDNFSRNSDEPELLLTVNFLDQSSTPAPHRPCPGH